MICDNCGAKLNETGFRFLPSILCHSCGKRCMPEKYMSSAHPVGDYARTAFLVILLSLGGALKLESPYRPYIIGTLIIALFISIYLGKIKYRKTGNLETILKNHNIPSSFTQEDLRIGGSIVVLAVMIVIISIYYLV